MNGTRWAREDEIKKTLYRNKLSDSNCQFHGGLPVISDGDAVYVDDSDRHSLIIGSTGSKKTRLLGMPMLELFCLAGESVLVSDPKGEMYQHTAKAFEKEGYLIYTINLRDPSRSDGWNPLAMARESMQKNEPERAAMLINDLAATLIKENPAARNDAFWTQTARAVLQGIANILVENSGVIDEKYINLKTMKALSIGMKRESDFTETTTIELIEKMNKGSLARSNLDSVTRGSEATFENIMASYNAPMQSLYMQNSLVDMLSTNTVDFADLGRKKTILYLIMPDEKTTLHTIVSLIIKQCYERLIELAQHCEGNTLPIRVNFLLDEFSNLPKIPDMCAMISAARSRNIRFHLIIQGLYQLSSKYGEDDAQTIKGNCENWAFLTSRELPLLEEISQLCGTDDVTNRQLITVSQLQRLNKESGEVLMLLGRCYPYIAHLPDISLYWPIEEGIRELPVLDRSQAVGASVEMIDTMIREGMYQKEKTAKVERDSSDLGNTEQAETEGATEEELAKEESDALQEELNRRFEELFGKRKKES